MARKLYTYSEARKEAKRCAERGDGYMMVVELPPNPRRYFMVGRKSKEAIERLTEKYKGRWQFYQHPDED